MPRRDVGAFLFLTLGIGVGVAGCAKDIRHSK